jgi:iron complex transport system permease protein
MNIITSPKNQLFIPSAILIGGWLQIFADTITLYILRPDGILASVMVAFSAHPFLCFYYERKRMHNKFIL